MTKLLVTGGAGFIGSHFIYYQLARHPEDRILCLEDGRGKGWGSHRELLETCSVYRAIYESQIGGA